MSAKYQDMVDIVEGDNKFDLFSQLFDWGRLFRDRKLFMLTLRNKQTSEEVLVPTYIRGIKEVTGTDERFMIDVVIAKYSGWDLTQYVTQYPWLSRFLEFGADYDTRVRKGPIYL